MATTTSQPAPTDAQVLLLAASNHDIPVLRSLLKTSTPNIQDPTTLQTPLHAAIASCPPSDPPERLETAEKTVRLLLQNGAIWNDLDANGETPGCVAYRLGLTGLYEVMVDAGVRAEMLLGRLDAYEELSDGEEEEDVEEVEEDEEREAPELVDATPKDGEEEVVLDIDSGEYLNSELTYHEDKLLDADKNGVMMAWETEIMKRSVDALVPEQGLRILNIGFGMGIVDGLFQEKQPQKHVIVEPHPDVLKKMIEDGWDKKPNVEILFGRWQDKLPEIVARGETFDAIYFDTFAEPYTALKEFFSEYVVNLLESVGGRFSFFHGLGADRRISYDVYTKVVEMDLFEAGLETTWEIVPLEKGDGREWKGVRRRYWVLGEYKLPVCVFMSMDF
ncbi:Arginine N-methyltransferase 2 [Rhizina undulata]